MPKRTKLVIGISLLLGVLLCLLLCVLGYIGIKSATAQKYPQHAKRIVNITIDTSQREKLFDQVRKFATKHGFTIRIDAQPSGAEDFLIYMTRGDIDVIGDNPFAPGEYGFGFYDADLRHPTPDSVFDDLVNDLKSYISEIPNATFSVEK